MSTKERPVIDDKDSHIIDILPGPNKENIDTQNNKLEGGLPEKEIIRRYREYANKFQKNPTEWPNKRHKTTCKDIENGCDIRKLYDKELSYIEIIAIINKDFHGYNSPKSVLIENITAANEYGYTFMNYNPTSIFSGLFGKFGFGGKSHKKRKSHKKPCKSRKSQKRKSIIKRK